ncbi:unnamed protein product [Penicillium salamii]|nr:unnamed protein product [Penicillium salamii]CAG8256261.1 unnamed protein product [Penicillium salamii]
MHHLMLQVLELPFFSYWQRAKGKHIRHVDRSSRIPVIKAPLIYSKTEELVWKWEQSKLCGQSINTTLSSTTVPQGHPPNKADSRGKFVSIQNGVVHVFPQAQLTNLEPHDYQIGILEAGHPASLKIILFGAKKENQTESLRASLIRLQRFPMERVRPVFNSWSTESWVSDSVVIDSKSTEEAGFVLKAVRPESLDETAYVCVGLPVTIFGPLFNTLISKWNASAASWLISAKLVFRLERSSREKGAILAELLEVSHIQITSYKPITHS